VSVRGTAVPLADSSRQRKRRLSRRARHGYNPSPTRAVCCDPFEPVAAVAPPADEQPERRTIVSLDVVERLAAPADSRGGNRW